jgi:hypothetical protein
MNERLIRLYWLAIARKDHAAALIIRARFRSEPWRPEPDYPVWTRRLAA